MERLLRPTKFAVLHSDINAEKQWKYWKKCFQNFIGSIPTPAEGQPVIDKLALLFNYIDSEVYEYIADIETYDAAIKAMDTLYLKPTNIIYARHMLATRKQETSESLDTYLQKLKSLAKECQCAIPTTVQEYEDDLVRDAFISGIRSHVIRQRLLEEKKLTLSDAFDKARAIEVAQQHSQSYQAGIQELTVNAVNNLDLGPQFQRANSQTSDSESSSGPISPRPMSPESERSFNFALNATSSRPGGKRCRFCGNLYHERSICPSRDANCYKCGKPGHFSNVCRSSGKEQSFSNAINREMDNESEYPRLSSIIAGSPKSLDKTVVKVVINKDIRLDCLIDSGSSDTFISDKVVKANNIKSEAVKSASHVSLAAGKGTAQVVGSCVVDLEMLGNRYKNVRMQVLDSLCSDVVVGLDFMEKHKSIKMYFGGEGPDLLIDCRKSFCNLTTVNIEAPPLFAYLDADCHPIATGSRRYSKDNVVFIRNEVSRLLKEGIIERSISPWRAQVVVTSGEKSKKRMVVDYSQTINKYTQLDAYPLPVIHNQVSEISRYKFYSHLDLASAYHQIPLQKHEKLYTAFEADGNLYQFKRVPFGVTNGVSCFQRTIDDFIKSNDLQGTFAYVDNVTVCGRNKEEHDSNLEKFLKLANQYNLTFNDNKSVICKDTIDILGYRISHNNLRPDPDRLKPLRDLPAPNNMKGLKRIQGMFAYYSSWIPKFSDKIRPLLEVTSFPLNEEALSAFNNMKHELESATLQTIDEKLPFTVETDASDFALAAILNQGGRPVAFFSRTLHKSEKSHPAVEKEACSIVEALRKWKHFLCGRHFVLYTDQESVSFMFDRKKLTKIKNDKIMRWRTELSCYDFDIIHRPGTENVVADTMSRAFSASISTNQLQKLKELHNTLAHPGITRLLHFVRSKNLNFSTEDVRYVVNNCKVCCKIKPRFYKDPKNKHLIKATHPFDRLNVDFKGPLPASPGSPNRYILNIVDEYSRFPFAFACPNTKIETVKSCLYQLFAIFGMAFKKS